MNRINIIFDFRCVHFRLIFYFRKNETVLSVKVLANYKRCVLILQLRENISAIYLRVRITVFFMDIIRKNRLCAFQYPLWLARSHLPSTKLSHNFPVQSLLPAFHWNAYILSVLVVMVLLLLHA